MNVAGTTYSNLVNACTVYALETGGLTVSRSTCVSIDACKWRGKLQDIGPKNRQHISAIGWPWPLNICISISYRKTHISPSLVHTVTWPWPLNISISISYRKTHISRSLVHTVTWPWPLNISISISYRKTHISRSLVHTVTWPWPLNIGISISYRKTHISPSLVHTVCSRPQWSNYKNNSNQK